MWVCGCQCEYNSKLQSEFSFRPWTTWRRLRRERERKRESEVLDSHRERERKSRKICENLLLRSGANSPSMSMSGAKVFACCCCLAQSQTMCVCVSECESVCMADNNPKVLQAKRAAITWQAGRNRNHLQAIFISDFSGFPSCR